MVVMGRAAQLTSMSGRSRNKISASYLRLKCNLGKLTPIEGYL